MSMFTWKCRRVEGALEDYTRGELPVADSQRVAAHLSDCESCRGKQEALFVVRCALEAYPRIVPSLNFDTVILNRMNDSRIFQSARPTGFFQHLRSLLPLIPRPPRRRMVPMFLGTAVGFATILYLLWPSLHPASAPQAIYSSTIVHHQQDTPLLDQIPPELLNPDWLRKNQGRYDYQPQPPSSPDEDGR